MKKMLCLALVLSACYSAKNNELVGQVKKVVDKTPILCPDYTEVDISLGVMRNGVGSMSKEDVELYVSDPTSISMLKQAAETGQLVKVTYDVKRLPFCYPAHHLTSAVILEK